MARIRIKRGTRAQLNAAAASALLAAGEPYLIVDEERYAIGLSATTYRAFPKGVYVGDTPPPDALPAEMWLSSLDGSLSIRYDDGTSTQWVVSSGPAGPRGPAGADGAKGDKGDTGATGSPGDPAAATLSISDQTAASTLPATGSAVGIQAFLQTARNCLKWLVANFDSSGKANDALKWNGANKTVSTSAPSGGTDGDIWFQREA